MNINELITLQKRLKKYIDMPLIGAKKVKSYLSDEETSHTIITSEHVIVDVNIFISTLMESTGSQFCIDSYDTRLKIIKKYKENNESIQKLYVDIVFIGSFIRDKEATKKFLIDLLQKIVYSPGMLKCIFINDEFVIFELPKKYTKVKFLDMKEILRDNTLRAKLEKIKMQISDFSFNSDITENLYMDGDSEFFYLLDDIVSNTTNKLLIFSESNTTQLKGVDISYENYIYYCEENKCEEVVNMYNHIPNSFLRKNNPISIKNVYKNN